MSVGEEELPIAVGPEEFVLRAIGKENARADQTLRWQTFKIRDPETYISVIRSLIGPAATKAAALRIKEDAYVGVAEAQVGDVRELGHDVVDSRAVYYGHADLLLDGKLQIPMKDLKDHEPERATIESHRREELYKALAATFHVRLDEQPGEPDGRGLSLTSA